jgi:hypothetical protein
MGSITIDFDEKVNNRESGMLPLRKQYSPYIEVLLLFHEHWRKSDHIKYLWLDKKGEILRPARLCAIHKDVWERYGTVAQQELQTNDWIAPKQFHFLNVRRFLVTAAFRTKRTWRELLLVAQLLNTSPKVLRRCYDRNNQKTYEFDYDEERPNRLSDCRSVEGAALMNKVVDDLLKPKWTLLGFIGGWLRHVL